MKENDCRLAKVGEMIYGRTSVIRYKVEKNDIIYVDSNNYLHNLYGEAWFYYYIHGEKIELKDWLQKREFLLLEQHRLDILEEM